jgi:hypothetical protein
MAYALLDAQFVYRIRETVAHLRLYHLNNCEQTGRSKDWFMQNRQYPKKMLASAGKKTHGAVQRANGTFSLCVVSVPLVYAVVYDNESHSAYTVPRDMHIMHVTEILPPWPGVLSDKVLSHNWDGKKYTSANWRTSNSCLCVPAKPIQDLAVDDITLEIYGVFRHFFLFTRYLSVYDARVPENAGTAVLSNLLEQAVSLFIANFSRLSVH